MPCYNEEALVEAKVRNLAECLAKKAYLRFYLSPRTIAQVLRHPGEFLISRIGTYKEAIASILWRKWRIAAPPL